MNQSVASPLRTISVKATVPRLLWSFAALGAIVGAAIIFVIGAPTTEPDAPLKRLSLTTLERRLTTIDEQLLSLAKPSMRTGVGAVGYRSIPQVDSAQPEWIQIALSLREKFDRCWRSTVISATALERSVSKRTFCSIAERLTCGEVTRVRPSFRAMPTAAC